MKKAIGPIIFFLAGLLLFMFVVSDQANAQDTCYTISNADQRNYCRARAMQRADMCYAITAPDVRAACIAELRGKRQSMLI